MHNLKPVIQKLSSDFFGILADLVDKYPHVSGIGSIDETLGVKEQMKLIQENTIFFLSYYHRKQDPSKLEDTAKGS